MDQSGGAGQLDRLRASGVAARHDASDVADNPTAVAALIEFRNVGHTYRSLLGRTVRAVDNFSLTIRESEVFGLAGPNGAGKSTLISLLLGYLEPTDGAISIAGLTPREFVERHGIGYLSELIAIPPRWSLEHALQRYAILAGIPSEQRSARTETVIGLLGLDEQRGKRVKQLSKGNLQRLGLAQALLREEQIIILDEPTHGLDPVWTQRFRDVVEALRRPGRTIFIASHNLDELQRLADRVAIIDGGQLQRVVEPRATRGSIAPYILSVVGDAAIVRSVFPSARTRGDAGGADGEYELPALDLATLNAGVAVLLQRGVLLSSLRPAHSLLEQHFREAVGE
jgi:ABC-type multidrug transport system ATPase subunit